MTFHSTTAPRIREIDSACTVEHRATLHYSDTNCNIGVDIAVVTVKSVEEEKACPNLIGTS